jgi:hypothetical protein
MNEKILVLTSEVQEKEEYARELAGRLEEKEAIMEQREREEQEYLRRI